MFVMSHCSVVPVSPAVMDLPHAVAEVSYDCMQS